MDSFTILIVGVCVTLIWGAMLALLLLGAAQDTTEKHESSAPPGDEEDLHPNVM